ncbi:MAG: F0F1 ATP synthase subunit delta [Gammaproteobacteria bacterium]|nr:F0F1 ATP synthase subunit delta [Gammaproteobacteria bacterium]
MAENSTLARPYAQAVFGLAKDANDYVGWSNALAALAEVVNTAPVQSILGNPKVSKSALVDILTTASGEAANDKFANFVALLVENNRLKVVPEIAGHYAQYRADAESVVDATVTSAYEVTAAQQDAIKAALKARLGRDVALTCSVDQSLVGGAVIRAGDLVIDGSVTNKLNKLNLALGH